MFSLENYPEIEVNFLYTALVLSNISQSTSAIEQNLPQFRDNLHRKLYYYYIHIYLIFILFYATKIMGQ